MDRAQFLWSITLLGCAVAAPAALAQERSAQNPSAPQAEAGLSAGAEVYRKWCSDCHSAPTGPGSMALQRKYQGALPAILEQRSGMNREYVALVVRRGISFMPSFRKTEISDAELALMAEYLVSAAGSQPQAASGSGAR